MDVSVIIVNYNTKEITRNCIDSIIEKTDGISYEIILVDNDSQDGSKELFEKDNRITYIYSNENLGFGKANNLGASYASGKYLFLLNSDTLLVNNAIKLFYDEFETKKSNIACLGCLLKDTNGKVIHSYGRFPTLWNEILRRPFSVLRYVGVTHAGYDTPAINTSNTDGVYVEYVTGADLFVKKDVADKYGLFDPDFFMYYEDAEMQYRYRKHGYESYISSKPSIIHLEGGSDKKKSNPWTGNSLNGLFICYRKMYGNFSCTTLRFVLFLLMIPKAVFDFRFSYKDKISYFCKIIHS